MTSSISPTSVKYFFGRISRDEAETILTQHGSQQGMYLLRESMSAAGNYALSICHQGRMHHYSIEKQNDGNVMIQDGRRFPGPVELIQHHEHHIDGLLTRPTIPCERPPGQAPMAWVGVTMLELENALLQKATSEGITGESLKISLGPQRQQFINVVARDLHHTQPWFHGRMERDEADRIMYNDGHADGKFLVRERQEGNSFALSLSYSGETKHYKVDRHPGNQLAIEQGPKFDSLMDMIGHYYNRENGLLCRLTQPCTRPGYRKVALTSIPMERNNAYGAKEDIFPFHPLPDVQMPSGAGRKPSIDIQNRQLPPTPGASAHSHRELPRPPSLPEAAAGGPKTGILGKTVANQSWEEPEPPDDDVVDGLSNGVGAAGGGPAGGMPMTHHEEQQKIYDAVPRSEDMFKLNRDDLELKEKLGSGMFGSVLKGTFKRRGMEIPVAVKTLKQGDLATASAEVAMMKEARIMASLDHKHIVRMIGVCRAESIMLVLELAQLGPLHKYLKNNKSLPVNTVLELMFQVSKGMEYLESKNFVHRDLAARNVLLVNERFCKISDFGMSRALGLDSNYYKADEAGKWPLKWYAPECIYYFKFDSKSDVWSFGVTLWEAVSYGQRPYRNMKGQQILEMIENNKRLERPEKCPPGVHDLMLRCWSYYKKDRPSFSELTEALRKYKR